MGVAENFLSQKEVVWKSSGVVPAFGSRQEVVRDVEKYVNKNCSRIWGKKCRFVLFLFCFAFKN